MKSRLLFLMAATFATSALAQGVEEEFQGRWTVASAATVARITADAEMSEENKAYWGQRFTDGPESKLELAVTSDYLEIPGLGRFSFAEILEASPGHVSVSSSIKDPGSGDEFSLVLHLAIQQDGTLNMQLDSGGAFDDDDFDRVMWTRGGEGEAASTSASSDPVGYLDSLKACQPGEFRFSTMMGDIHSTIVGRNEDRCRVTTESGGHTIVCNYSDATVALLTSEQKYDDARNGIMQGSTDSEESRRINEECSVGSG